MGMDVFVKGIRKPDERHQRMLAVAKSCREAEVPIPVEVSDYFGGVMLHAIEETSGLEVDVPIDVDNDASREGETRWEVKVADIPKGVERIRFSIGY